MAAALILLFSSCLLPGALCRQFKVIMPQTIEILSGSCVTIPCSFDIEDKYESNLDHTCSAKWLINNRPVFDSKTSATKDGRLIGNLTRKDCTTTLNSTQYRVKYIFRLECQNSLMYSFKDTVTLLAKADPPNPTLSPPTLEMREGASVSLKCSAPAPCLSLPPHITWTSGLGDSHGAMEELEEKAQVKTSVLNFTISRLHHRKEISCAATYSTNYGSTVSAVSQHLKAVVSFSPQILDSSNCTNTATEVNCCCEAEGNPLPTVHWTLDGTRLNRSVTYTMNTEPLSDTVLKSIIALRQSLMKHHSTLVCNISNSLGSISRRLYNSEQQTSADQGHVTMTVITTLASLLLCALFVIIGIRAQARLRHCSFFKRPSTDDTSSAAVSHFQSGTEANELADTEEDRIYVNMDQIRQADVPHPTSETAENNEDVIYSTVTVRSKHNKQQRHQDNAVDLQRATYAETETATVEIKVESEYSQLKFKDRCNMHK